MPRDSEDPSSQSSEEVSGDDPTMRQFDNTDKEVRDLMDKYYPEENKHDSQNEMSNPE